MRRLLLTSLTLFVAPTFDLHAQGLGPLIDDIAESVVEDELAVGLVVGTLIDGQTAFRGFGLTEKDSGELPDEHTLFEIGSVTKVFTGILLAYGAHADEVALTDPIAELLPKEVVLESHESGPVRLVDLSTHASGLPRMPPDFLPGDPRNPYADYDAEKLYVSLGKIRPRRAVGAQYEYSNLAQGLLGHALATRVGTDYETLVRKRILDPLRMRDTTITLGEKHLARLATGYDQSGNAASNWDLDALAGAGALRSTASDMLLFAAANLEPGDSKLGRALATAQEIHHEFASNGLRIGLGWHTDVSGHGRWHNGGTGGYRSFFAIRPDQGVAVIVLASTTSQVVDEVGNELLTLLVE